MSVTGGGPDTQQHANRLDGAASSRTRNVVAALVCCIPLGVIVATAVGWWHELPATLPRQWSSAGVSATMPLWAFFTVVLVIAAGTATGALFTIPKNADPNRRQLLYATGAAGAAAAGVWICGAGVALVTPAGSVPDIGGYPLLALVIGVVFGLIPMLLATRWSEPDGGL